MPRFSPKIQQQPGNSPIALLFVIQILYNPDCSLSVILVIALQCGQIKIVCIEHRICLKPLILHGSVKQPFGLMKLLFRNVKMGKKQLAHRISFIQIRKLLQTLLGLLPPNGCCDFFAPKLHVQPRQLTHHPTDLKSLPAPFDSGFFLGTDHTLHLSAGILKADASPVFPCVHQRRVRHHRYPADIAEKIRIPQHLLFRCQKVSLRPDGQIRASPALAFQQEHLLLRLQGACDFQNLLLQPVFHRALFVDGLKKFFHIPVLPVSGQPSVQLLILPIRACQKYCKILAEKQICGFLPIGPCQIGKMKQIAYLTHGRGKRLFLPLRQKGDGILSAGRYHPQLSFNDISLVQSQTVKGVCNLCFPSLKPGVCQQHTGIHTIHVTIYFSAVFSGDRKSSAKLFFPAKYKLYSVTGKNQGLLTILPFFLQHFCNLFFHRPSP